jgi:hypothetical protein
MSFCASTTQDALVVHTHHEYMYLKLSMDEQLIEVSVLIRQSKQPIVDHPPLTEKTHSW